MTLPTKWTNKTLLDLATINYGRDPSAILDDAGEYPVYGTSGSERQGTGYHYEGESIILGRKGALIASALPKAVSGRSTPRTSSATLMTLCRSGCTTSCAASICAH